MKPIYYKGSQITTYNDILDHLDLDLLNPGKIKAESKELFDEEFFKLIQRVKPDIKYFEQGFGDKLLYLRRVDKLKYDILEEQKLRKQRAFQLEMKKARELRDAGKGGQGIGSTTNTEAGLASIGGGKTSIMSKQSIN